MRRGKKSPTPMRAEGQEPCAADERGTIWQSGIKGERPMNGGPASLNWADSFIWFYSLSMRETISNYAAG